MLWFSMPGPRISKDIYISCSEERLKFFWNHCPYGTEGRFPMVGFLCERQNPKIWLAYNKFVYKQTKDGCISKDRFQKGRFSTACILIKRPLVPWAFCTKSHLWMSPNQKKNHEKENHICLIAEWECVYTQVMIELVDLLAIKKWVYDQIKII